MTPNSAVRKLSAQIQALPAEDRVELLRNILTPELELRLLVEDLSRRNRAHDPGVITRDVNQAVREVRLERAGRATA